LVNPITSGVCWVWTFMGFLIDGGKLDTTIQPIFHRRCKSPGREGLADGDYLAPPQKNKAVGGV
jgi:hypothetical protein